MAYARPLRRGQARRQRHQPRHQLKPGTNTNAYIAAVTRRLGTADYFVETPAGSSVAAQVKSSYFHLLAVLIAVLAALGVLNSVLMFVHVLGPGELALLTLAGRAIAAAGALGPGTWAAASRATTALHAE